MKSSLANLSNLSVCKVTCKFKIYTVIKAAAGKFGRIRQLRLRGQIGQEK